MQTKLWWPISTVALEPQFSLFVYHVTICASVAHAHTLYGNENRAETATVKIVTPIFVSIKCFAVCFFISVVFFFIRRMKLLAKITLLSGGTRLEFQFSFRLFRNVI